MDEQPATEVGAANDETAVKTAAAPVGSEKLEKLYSGETEIVASDAQDPARQAGRGSS
jgi:hypothetical protein